jgi:hypothetical protein
MRRVPHLEELLKRPVLQRQRLTAEQLADLQATPVPVPPRLLWQSLQDDPAIGHPVMRTDLHAYDPKLPSYHKAAWLIKSAVGRLSLERRWNTPRGIGPLRAAQFIATESRQLAEELERTGKVGEERSHDLAYLLGKWRAKLSDEQLTHVKRVIVSVQQCDTLHPVLKRRMVGLVCMCLVNAAK